MDLVYSDIQPGYRAKRQRLSAHPMFSMMESGDILAACPVTNAKKQGCGNFFYVSKTVIC